MAGEFEVLDSVVSEVHTFSKEEVLEASGGAVLSRFNFTYPSYLIGEETVQNQSVTLDSDGDLDVVRKNDLDKKEGVILIEHQSATTLDLVGEQVWRGALFLADFIIQHPEIFKNASILEVASGVGLTSVVAAMIAKKVIITDVDKGDILDLVHRNVNRNKELLQAEIMVEEIDFFKPETIGDLNDIIKNVSILLAADVVYHNQLTDAFFSCILNLMSRPPNKTMYIALEKRYVFTLEDLDTVAPCYEYFLEGLQNMCRNDNKVAWTVD